MTRTILTSAFCDSPFPSEMSRLLCLCVFVWMLQSSWLCCQHYSQMASMQIYDRDERSIIRFWGTEASKEMEMMWKRQLRAYNKSLKTPVFNPKGCLYTNNDWGKQLISIFKSMFIQQSMHSHQHSFTNVLIILK